MWMLILNKMILNKMYLCEEKGSLLKQTWHTKAAQSSDEEAVVGLWPVTAHHLHCYPCCTDSTERQSEKEWEREDISVEE